MMKDSQKEYWGSDLIVRVLFNYSKWIFPIIELKNGSAAIHRGILFLITVSIIASAAYDGIKWLAHLF